MSRSTAPQLPPVDRLTARKIFQEWWRVYREPNPTQWWSLPVLHYKAQQRWFNQGYLPGSKQAVKLAIAVWEDIALPNPRADALRPKIFAAVKKHAAQASLVEWESDVSQWRQTFHAFHRDRWDERPRSVRSGFARWLEALAGGDEFKTDTEPDKLHLVEFDVLCGSNGATDPSRFRSISGERVLPVRHKDRLIIEVQTSAPACIYLFWIFAHGGGVPLFPSDLAMKGDVIVPTLRIDLNYPRKELRLGERFEWNFDNTSGLETIVAFVRTEPLARERLQELQRRFAKWEGTDLPALGPFADDLGQLFENLDRERVRMKMRPRRGITIGPLSPMKDYFAPVHQRHRAIAAELHDDGVVGTCMSFRNAGSETF